MINNSSPKPIDVLIEAVRVTTDSLGTTSDGSPLHELQELSYLKKNDQDEPFLAFQLSDPRKVAKQSLNSQKSKSIPRMFYDVSDNLVYTGNEHLSKIFEGLAIQAQRFLNAKEAFGRIFETLKLDPQKFASFFTQSTNPDAKAQA